MTVFRILFLTLLSFNARAQSQACLAQFNTPYLKWSKLPVELYLDSKLPTVFNKALIKGIETWNSEFKEKVFLYKGKSKDCTNPDINCLSMEIRKRHLKI